MRRGLSRGFRKVFRDFLIFSEDLVLYWMRICYEMVPYSYTTMEYSISSELDSDSV